MGQDSLMGTPKPVKGLLLTGTSFIERSSDRARKPRFKSCMCSQIAIWPGRTHCITRWLNAVLTTLGESWRLCKNDNT